MWAQVIDAKGVAKKRKKNFGRKIGVASLLVINEFSKLSD